MNGLEILHPYRCVACSATFWWNFYDLMNLTNVPRMPCGCAWTHLSYVYHLEKHTSEQ